MEADQLLIDFADLLVRLRYAKFCAEQAGQEEVAGHLWSALLDVKRAEQAIPRKEAQRS